MTGEYYFTTTKVRPSAGLILGLYTQESAGLKGSEDGIEDTSGTRNSVGISPRLKVSLGRFVVSYTYHFTFDSEVYDFSTVNLGWYMWGDRY